MKRTHVCPKCNDMDIIKIEGDVRGYGAGNNIQTGMTIFSSVLVHRYLCCKCGYSEEWVDTEDIGKLKKKYEKA